MIITVSDYNRKLSGGAFSFLVQFCRFITDHLSFFYKHGLVNGSGAINYFPNYLFIYHRGI